MTSDTLSLDLYSNHWISRTRSLSSSLHSLIDHLTDAYLYPALQTSSCYKPCSSVSQPQLDLVESLPVPLVEVL